MKNEERRKAARRRWYYRNRKSKKVLKSRIPDVPLLSVEERKTISRANAVVALAKAHAKAKIKSDQIQRKREERRCVICGGPVLVKNLKAKSCSVRCAKIARRKRRENWEKACAYCGSTCSGQNKYCDDCNKSQIYKMAQSTEDVSDSKAVKRLVLRRRGHRCEGCGLDQWMGKAIPLELHHVDGDSENNKDENLQLLCPNCHALTPTFRNRNKRKASERRRKIRKTREFAEVAQEEVAAVL